MTQTAGSADIDMIGSVGRKPRKWQPPRPVIPTTIAFVLFGLYTAFFAVRAVLCLLFPYPTEYGEGTVLYEGWQIARLYADNRAPDYLASNYTPLYYVLVALPTLLFGPVLWFGRLLSIFATLVVGWAIYRTCRTMNVRPAFAWAAALIVPALPPVFFFGAVHKPDMVAVALSVAALTVLSDTNVQVFTRRQIILSAGLCLLAVYTKQSALAAPVAIGLWLLLRDWRKGLLFGAVLGGVGLTLAGVLQVITGNTFWLHVLTYNQQRIEAVRIVVFFFYLLTTYPLFMMSIAVALGFCLFRSTARRSSLCLWALYSFIGLGLSVSVGKVGSNINYGIEPLLGATVLAAVLLGRGIARGKRWRAVLIWLVALQLIALHHIPIYADETNTPTFEQWQNGAVFSNAIRDYAAHGPVLLYDSGWSTPLGIRTELDDPFLFQQIAEDGTWDETDFVERLHNGHYGLVVVRAAALQPNEKPDIAHFRDPIYLTPRMRAALLATYRVERVQGDKWLFVPAAR